MNASSETGSPEAIRSSIDQTRDRMDSTLNRLGDRLQPRHLVDEAIGYLRQQSENGNMKTITNRLSNAANSAAHSVVDTVKSNPLPIALVGAGVAWYLYSRSHSESSRYRYADFPQGADDDLTGFYDDPDDGADHAFGGDDASESAGARGLAGQASEKLHTAGDQVRQKARELGSRARDSAAQLRNRSRELYRRGRDQVAVTVEEHPLASGMVVLALGLIAGAALPTSQRVRRTVAPQVRQVRRRGEELLQRGRRVVDSAMAATREEAEKQGLTPSAILGKRQSNGSPAQTTTPGASAPQSPALSQTEAVTP